MSKSQSSWHWKANITQQAHYVTFSHHVAILMTLEGEYYDLSKRGDTCKLARRNPHDIGRRILLCQKVHYVTLPALSQSS